MAKLAKADEKNFAELLQGHSHQISKALGSTTGKSLDKFLMSTMNLVRQNPNLLQCDQFSILNAIRECATLGLSLDPNMGEASIVPFKKVGKLIPGYRGLIKLATRSGHVSHMQARLFYREEYDSGNFQYEEGTNPSIHHIPLPPSERKTLMGAYSVAKLSDGETSFDLMWAEDIERIKKSAPGSKHDDSAWNTNPDEMWRKSVVRRHIKYLNISNEMGDAIATAVKDEYFDAGIVPDVPLTEPKPTKAIEKGEQVADASDAKKDEEKEKNKQVSEKPSTTNRGGSKAKQGGEKNESGHGDEAVGGAGEPNERRGISPDAESVGKEEDTLNLFSPADEIKANVRELAEALEIDKEEGHRIQLEKCGDDLKALNEYRLKLVKDLNTKFNKD